MNGNPTRGAFLTSSAAAFASIAIVRAPARAAQWSYKAGTNQKPDHPLSVAMRDIWDAVRKDTNGRLDVAVFPNNQLGGDSAMLTQLRSGALQFMTLDPGILSTVIPVAGIGNVGYSFGSPAAAHAAFDGRLGAYIRAEIATKNLYAFEKIWENGMRNVTSTPKPIRNAADFANFKIRTPEGKIYVDLFRELGAAPTPINFSELYTALQTHVVDGQENPLLNIEFARLFEVQKYLSLTNHMWAGYWLLANGDVWKDLPPDVQAVVSKHAAAYTVRQRRDVMALNDSLVGKLKSQGMEVNTADTASMRAKLHNFYKTWQGEYGATAWNLLESYAGKLG